MHRYYYCVKNQEKSVLEAEQSLASLIDEYQSIENNSLSQVDNSNIQLFPAI